MNKFNITIYFLVLICNINYAQDTLYIYKSDKIIFKKAISEIDSISFYNNLINDSNGEINDSLLKVNEFIYDYMNFYYFWNEELPEKELTKETDPYMYFESLLYKPHDRWSYITSNYDSLKNSITDREKTKGFNFVLYKYNNSDNVFGIINLVHSNSPAFEKGIKRGDFLTAINGIELNIDNYSNLLNLDSYTITIAKLEVNQIVPVKDVELTSTDISINPIYYYDTISFGNKSIGYLVFNKFQSSFKDSLTNVFLKFKALGIDELILDLRYNSGGTVKEFQHLASLIAPEQLTLAQDTIINNLYNPILSEYYETNEMSTSVKFEYTEGNLNLNRIYIITGRSTQAAAESLIIGLDPYMDVITIGENTFGKCYGSFILNNLNNYKNWAIIPVVFKVSNSVGFTDFTEGLSPTYIGDDDIFHELGDTEEGLLNLTLGKIIGSSNSSVLKKAKIPFKALPIENKKKNSLFIIPPPIK